MEAELVVHIVGSLKLWRKQFCSNTGDYVFWGHIYGDTRLRFPDGHWIHTAKVEKVVNDLVYTASGSVYRLVGPSDGPDVNPWRNV